LELPKNEKFEAVFLKKSKISNKKSRGIRGEPFFQCALSYPLGIASYFYGTANMASVRLVREAVFRA
jgi:hypothetical protein